MPKNRDSLCHNPIVNRSRRFEDPVTSMAHEEHVSVRGLTRSAASWDPNHPIRDKYSSLVLPCPSSRSWESSGHPSQRPARKIGKIGTDTIIVTICGIRGHGRACHGLLESLHPATRIKCGNEGIIVRRSLGTTAIQRHTMTERPLEETGSSGMCAGNWMSNTRAAEWKAKKGFQ